MSAATNINYPAILDLVCMQGVTFDPILKFYDDDDKEDPSDLNGSTFVLQVRDGANDLKLEFSTADGEGITVQNDNELAFNKSAEEMDVEPGIYRYDLIETTYEGEVIPSMAGTFTIKKRQTELT